VTPRAPGFAPGLARGLALGLLLMSATATAGTAYVSDELVLNVYAEENNQGQRLATLHSGAGVETLSVNGEYTQVRLGDGITGWVKSAFLTTQEPASVRVKQLEEELERTRAISPGLAEAAARSEIDRLSRELDLKQAQLDASHVPAPNDTAIKPLGIALIGGAVSLALGAGFWLGYASLARRVRRKFGGIRVY
jgi:SH3-like domain-containing protein